MDRHGENDAPIVLSFGAMAPSARLRAYFEALRRPRAFVPLAVLTFFPAALDRAPALFVPSGGLDLRIAAMGPAALLAVLVIGAIATLARAGAPESYTFDAGGIRETRGREVTERPWSWITGVIEDDARLVLVCEEPMRSFRLAVAGAGKKLLVVEKSRPEASRLAALVREMR